MQHLVEYLNFRTLEENIGSKLIVSEEQNFESNWRVLVCKSSAEQASRTKSEIDRILKSAGLAVNDPNAMGLECHIVSSIPITEGIFYFIST